VLVKKTVSTANYFEIDFYFLGNKFAVGDHFVTILHDEVDTASIDALAGQLSRTGLKVWPHVAAPGSFAGVVDASAVVLVAASKVLKPHAHVLMF
jgi:hypothetical protein